MVGLKVRFLWNLMMNKWMNLVSNLARTARISCRRMSSKNSKKWESMYSAAAKMMVAEQITGMLENNVLRGCGMESFMGWLEDGDTFYVSYEDKYTEEQIKEAIRLSVEIAPMVDELSWKLNTSAEECDD